MNRKERWLFLSMALLGGILGGAVTVRLPSPSMPRAATTANPVITQRLILINKRGKKLAELAPADGGGALLTLYEYGDATLSLYATGGVSGVSLFDHHGKLRAALDVQHDGSPVLKFYDEAGAVSRKLP